MRTYLSSSEDNCTTPNEGVIVDDATLEVSVVSDGATVPDDRVSSVRAMEHGAILDRGLISDHNPTMVAAQNGTGPHTGLRADDDVPDDYCFGAYECVGCDPGLPGT